MMITIEISNPIQLKPWLIYRPASRLHWRAGWLWFAISYRQMREDEYAHGLIDGTYTWIDE